jgi:hypothetical protein
LIFIARITLIWYKYFLLNSYFTKNRYAVIKETVKGGNMGRYKAELKRIHGKKVRKAKGMLKLYKKGELPYEKLTQRAKKLLEKRKRQESKPV